MVGGALFLDPKGVALQEAWARPYPMKGYGSYAEMIEANASLACAMRQRMHRLRRRLEMNAVG